MKIYVSHPIRGIVQGPTPEYIEHNNLMARIFGAALRVRYPHHSFYVPAENEEFVALAYATNSLDETQILMLDGMIIDSKDGVIFYDHELAFSGGMAFEQTHAKNTNKPVATVASLGAVSELPELEVLLKCN